MKKFLLFIWQLPQNLIGFLMTRKPRHTLQIECNDGEKVTVYFTKNVFNCGVSLGNYIILDDDVYYKYTALHYNSYMNTVNHEHGHQIQSRYLGLLYLPTVGIMSSVFNNLWDRVFHKEWDYKKRQKWYYNRNVEKWADELGKVERKY